VVIDEAEDFVPGVRIRVLPSAKLHQRDQGRCIEDRHAFQELDEMACGSAMRAGENAMEACSSKMSQAFMLVADGVPDPCASSRMTAHPSGHSLPRFGAI
jgi:hypothetical protein